MQKYKGTGWLNGRNVWNEKLLEESIFVNIVWIQNMQYPISPHKGIIWSKSATIGKRKMNYLQCGIKRLDHYYYKSENVAIISDTKQRIQGNENIGKHSLS